MPYIKNDDLIGKTVFLTKPKMSMAGGFTANTVVKIVDVDPDRGYTFEDQYGNRVIEAGWDGFEILQEPQIPL